MKRLLIPILATLFSMASYAQVGELRSNLSIGANGGFNFSRVDFSPTIKQELHPGLTGGLTLRYTTEKYFSLICAAQFEVNFAQRGWKEFIDDGSNNTYHRTTNYVDISVGEKRSVACSSSSTQAPSSASSSTTKSTMASLPTTPGTTACAPTTSTCSMASK